MSQYGFICIMSSFLSCHIIYAVWYLYLRQSLLQSYFCSCRYCSVQYKESTLIIQVKLRMIRILDNGTNVMMVAHQCKRNNQKFLLISSTPNFRTSLKHVKSVPRAVLLRSGEVTSAVGVNLLFHPKNSPTHSLGIWMQLTLVTMIVAIAYSSL